jgi:hypothetical protein
MRLFGKTALLAVPLIVLFSTGTTRANSNSYTSHGFGCFDWCFRCFPHLNQNGPLFNYGPYYGYYPFQPYGPWDAYLRYNPFYYGDPYADFGNKQYPGNDGGYGRYGLNTHLQRIGLPGSSLFHKHGCTHCGFWHASWLHGGWFRGHAWLQSHPSLFTSHGHHKPACSKCGGLAVAEAPDQRGDVLARYTGFGSPAQSAVFYPITPTLDPALELLQTAGQAP